MHVFYFLIALFISGSNCFALEEAASGASDRATSSVPSIGRRFLDECTGLTSIDLSALSDITPSDHFLNGTTQLTSLDLRVFGRVTPPVVKALLSKKK